jgi:hypothetical protein
MDQFGQSAAEVQKKVSLLAIQMGDSSEGGMQQALQKAADVAIAGGTSLDTGAKILQSVISVYPEADQKLQIGLAKEISTLAGVNVIDPNSAGSIAEFLKATGKKDIGSASQALSQLDAAMKTSAALNFGPFADATIKGGIGLTTLGVDDQEVLRLMVQARTVAGGSDDVAGETLKMLGYSLNAPRMREHFKRNKIEGHPAKLKELEKIYNAALGGDKAADDLLEGKLRSEQLMRMTMLFSPNAEAQGAEFMKLSPSFTPEKYRAESAAFKDSKLGQQTLLDLGLEINRGQMGMGDFKNTMLNKLVQERLKQLKMDPNSPEAMMWFNSEEAMTDELAKPGNVRAPRGVNLEGASIPKQDWASSFRGWFSEMGKNPGPSDAYGPVYIGTYVEQQVVPNGNVTKLPAEAANARPGGS